MTEYINQQTIIVCLGGGGGGGGDGDEGNWIIGG